MGPSPPSQIISKSILGSQLQQFRHTNKSEHTPHNPNTKTQPLRIPPTQIQKRSKNLLGIALWAQNQQRDKNGKEPKYMQNQKRPFELRQQPSSCNVDDEAEEYDGPI
jgi:hypothetical protein